MILFSTLVGSRNKTTQITNNSIKISITILWSVFINAMDPVLEELADPEVAETPISPASNARKCSPLRTAWKFTPVVHTTGRDRSPATFATRHSVTRSASISIGPYFVTGQSVHKNSYKIISSLDMQSSVLLRKKNVITKENKITKIAQPKILPSSQIFQ
jgi:hypothetical protein